MDVMNNQDVGTPDGNGIVVGQSENGRIIVRLATKKAVDLRDAKLKARTCGGWQDEYDASQLTPPVPEKKVKA